MSVYLYGVNHKTAPLSVREHFAALPEKIIPGGNHGYVVLSTCNRTEFILNIKQSSWEPDSFFNILRRSLPKQNIDKVVYSFNGKDVLYHLTCVAAGLDSAIIGEPEIFGQLKQAVARSRDQGHLDKTLDALFQDCFRIGKLARTMTGVSRGALSLARVAADKVAEFRKKEDSKILIIGAGHINDNVLNHIRKHFTGMIFIANRTFQTAQELGRKYDAEVVHFDRLKPLLAEVDAVISATNAPHFILKKDNTAQILAERDKALIMVDLAVPRDIDPSLSSPQTTIFNIDDLKDTMRKTTAIRKKEAEKARLLIRKELNYEED